MKLADTHFTRLKGLLGRMELKSDEGIWVMPSQGIHTIGMLFPIDLIYLNSQNKVIHLIESFGTFRIGPFRRDSASVLELQTRTKLQTRTIYSSNTRVGDELLICSPAEMASFCKTELGSKSNCGAKSD